MTRSLRPRAAQINVTTGFIQSALWRNDIVEAGAVPARLTWDNETGIGRGRLTHPAAVFAGTLGTEIRLLRAHDPESKGTVERTHCFFCSRSMPGRVFASPDYFDTQLKSWLPTVNGHLRIEYRPRLRDVDSPVVTARG